MVIRGQYTECPIFFLHMLQTFALVLEQIPEFKSSLPKFRRQVNTIKRKHAGDNENIEKAEDKIRNAEVKKLIFNDVLRQAHYI